MNRNKINWLLLFGVVFMFQCCTSDYTKELGEGYIYRHEGKPLNDIYSENPKGGSIPANVISFDYDKKYIIAKQRPKLPQDILYEKEYEYKLGGDMVYFWLIIKKEKLILGPLSEKEFKEAKKKYKVPDKLSLN